MHRNDCYPTLQGFEKKLVCATGLVVSISAHRVYMIIQSEMLINSYTKRFNFGGPFNAKSLIQRALRKLHVNGATKLKLYSYIGLYLGVCQNFSARGRLEGAGLLNVNLGPPIISETTGARKLNLKTQVDVVKYSLWVQIFFH